MRDVVRISPDGSTAVEVVERSGSRVLRAFLVPELYVEQVRPEIAGIGAIAGGLNLLSEWSGGRHVAIDVPDGADPAALLDYLEAGERDGRLDWEWGDAVSFST